MNEKIIDSGNIKDRTKKIQFILVYGRVHGFWQQQEQLLVQKFYGISIRYQQLSESRFTSA